MDEIDRKLTALLRADARAPVARLARAVNLSRGAVQNRIDKMLAAGEIAGFTVRSAPEDEAGRVRAIMGIAVETNGRWDMIAERCTESLAGFSNALDNIRLIDGISATETSLLLKTHRM
jgi:DNA-binding Lrp family transcriptional regulator